MIERYPYGATAHHVAKLLAGESFPLTREELTAKYGDAPVGIDFDQTIPFGELLERMGLTAYETAVSFYAALNAKK